MKKLYYQNNGSPDLSTVISSRGVSYIDYKKNLKPKKNIIVIDLLIIISMFILGIYTSNLLNYYSLVLAIVFFFIWGTFWLKAYLFFFHEAAHFNFFPNNRRLNDILANIFLSPFIGMSVQSYRKTHWEHHKNLGTTDDTEISYIEPLEFRKILDILSLKYLFQTLLRYNKNFKKKNLEGFNFYFFIFLFFNISLVLIAYIFNAHFFIFSWIFIYLYGIPVTEKIRQTLEHRDFSADSNKNYKEINHGPINRLFGNDFLSRFFGAAGFNKHLLHHYDPTLSYTNFDEVENFFYESNLKNNIVDSKTKYLKCFLKMLKKNFM